MPWIFAKSWTAISSTLVSPTNSGSCDLRSRFFFGELMSWEFPKGPGNLTQSHVDIAGLTRALFQGGGIDSSQQKQQWLGRLEVFEFEWFVYDGRFSTRPVGLWFFCFNLPITMEWHSDMKRTEINMVHWYMLICHSGPLGSLVRNIDRRNPANHQWCRKPCK